MKLYVSPRAPNPRRVQMFIAEKGITGIELANGAISLIMLVLGALILISALRKWSELWKLRQQPEFRVAEATAS